MRFLPHRWVFLLPLLALGACTAPPAVQSQTAPGVPPKLWTHYPVLTGSKAPEEKSKRKFGCHSDDLANFTCE